MGAGAQGGRSWRAWTARERRRQDGQERRACAGHKADRAVRLSLSIERESCEPARLRVGSRAVVGCECVCVGEVVLCAREAVDGDGFATRCCGLEVWRLKCARAKTATAGRSVACAYGQRNGMVIIGRCAAGRAHGRASPAVRLRDLENRKSRDYVGARANQVTYGYLSPPIGSLMPTTSPGFLCARHFRLEKRAKTRGR